MSNSVKDKEIENQTHYFFDDIINIKSVDPNNIKIDEKSYKNILIRFYWTLVPTNESKEKIKKYEELWIKIRYFIR